MKFLLIYAHPNDKSFNHALFRTTRDRIVAAGHEVRVHDLYEMGFNPLLGAADFEAMAKGTQQDDVLKLQADISWAERLFFTYPIWWYNRPAMLQGYIDRVFSFGFAYGSGGQKFLQHDRALVFQTTGQPREIYLGDGDVTIHHAMKGGTLELCGVGRGDPKGVAVHTFYQVTKANEETRHQMLDEAAKLVDNFIQ